MNKYNLCGNNFRLETAEPLHCMAEKQGCHIEGNGPIIKTGMIVKERILAICKVEPGARM